MSDTVTHLLETSFDTKEIPESVFGFVQDILGARKPVGVIYYGSALWKKELSGLLDFYIVCETLSEWYDGFGLKRLANQWLPPNIEYYEWQKDTVSLRAKVAILSLEQLKKAMALQSLDTTMWARFCQPVKILWWRGATEKEALLRCLVRAVGTAVWWAAYLGPEHGTTESYWCSLFRNTYAAELRVESRSRPALILANRESYFASLLASGWKALGIAYIQGSDGILSPQLTKQQKRLAKKQWKIRKKIGRPLNVLRLIKAAFTFKGGAEYILWKINRHQNLDLQLSDFQKKHPLINAPWILIKLYRQGVFKR